MDASKPIDDSACRHCGAAWEFEWEYCPECGRNYGGAVYPATQTDAEVRDIARLIEQIRADFAEVRLKQGMTIHEADLEGAYTDPSVRDHARRMDPEQHWWEVPDWKIADHSSALYFFDPTGWRFYLPAYMCWSLKHWRTTNRTTVQSLIGSLTLHDWVFPEISLQRFRTLSRRQSGTVLEFLKHFDRYSPDREASEAITSYWAQFACENP